MENDWKRTGLWIAGLVVLGGLIAHAQESDRGKAQAVSSDGEPVGAQYSCEEFVKDALKSPSSAEFSEQDETHKGSVWIAHGSVDSENSFGAMIRNRYTCVVKYLDDDDETYEMVSLTGLSN